MATLSQILDQSKEFWAGLSAKQRFLLLGGAVLTVAVLAVFAGLIGKPEYKPLFTGMEPSDAQTLAAQLQAKNIQYQLSPDGKTISVAGDKLDAARLEVASQGMPHSGRMGFELFDKMNWGQTEFDEKVNYQRALEGELERTIQTLRDVESVRVHLVLPTDSVFLDRERSAKASVILKLRSGRISENTQNSIARLVSGAVDKLDPADVHVIDADTNQPLGLEKRGPLGSGGSEEQELTARLMATVEPIVGPERVRATVNVDYDVSTTEENQESYDPAKVVAVSTQRSEEQAGGPASGGVPGTSSNIPNAASGDAKRASVGGTMEMSKSESNTYAVNKTVRHTLQPAGRVRRISAALVVDDALEVKQEKGKTSTSRRKRTSEELKQIEEVAKAAIGFDPARGDTVVVQNVSFELPPPETPEKPTPAQRLRVTLNDWSAVIRYGALLLLFLLAYALLLRPMKKQALKALRQTPARKLPEAAKAAAANAASSEIEIPLPELPEERQRAVTLRKQLVDKIKAEPQSSSRLVQSWLREGAQ